MQEEKAEAEAVFALAGRESVPPQDLLTPLVACGWDESALKAAGLESVQEVSLEQLLDAMVTFSIRKPVTTVR